MPPAVAGRLSQPGPVSTPDQAAAPAVPGAPMPVRPLPRSSRGRAQAGALPQQEAAIPLERVPYFRADLRRIAITAGSMIGLLIIGSIVLRSLLQA